MGQSALRPSPNVSQYPASRVSSGCSCLITQRPTTLKTSTTSGSSTTKPFTMTIASSTTSTSSTSKSSTTATTTSFEPESSQCSGELIRNGGFETFVAPSGVPPWEFAPEDYDYFSRSYPKDNGDGNTVASLEVDNGPRGGYGSTFIKQEIPCLCEHGRYTLSFDAQTKVNGAGPVTECRLQIGLALRVESLVYNGLGSLPFDYEHRSYTFTYDGSTCPQWLIVWFTCTAPSATLQIDNISLVGLGTLDVPYPMGW